jgi:tetratricopeptide (TPR) repeat protein
MVTVFVVLAVAVVALPAVARLGLLNRYALATAARLLQLGAGPGWWLSSSPAMNCQPEAPPTLHHSMTQARLQRLYGLQAAYCGETTTAQTALAAAAAVLTGDTSLELLLGKPTTSQPIVGPALIAERARAAYDRGETAEAARWLGTAAAYLAEPPNADYRSLYFAACFIYRGLGELDNALLACQKYIAVSPNNKEAWNHLAATHLDRREWAEAEAAYRNPSSQEARRG